MKGHAERREHGQSPIQGVRVERFARHGEVVKAAGTFAGFVEADEKLSAREPRESATAEQALQINDEVEVLRAQPAEAAKHFRPVRRFGPAFALETDYASQIGIAFEQRCERRINPPENFRFAEMELQQTQHRQRLDDVAEGAGFEDEDFQMKNLE